MAWKDYIKHLNEKYTGREVIYENSHYTITHVDYNGVIHINKPTEHNETTAVDIEPCSRIKFV